MSSDLKAVNAEQNPKPIAELSSQDTDIQQKGSPSNGYCCTRSGDEGVRSGIVAF